VAALQGALWAESPPPIAPRPTPAHLVGRQGDALGAWQQLPVLLRESAARQSQAGGKAGESPSQRPSFWRLGPRASQQLAAAGRGWNDAPRTAVPWPAGQGQCPCDRQVARGRPLPWRTHAVAGPRPRTRTAPHCTAPHPTPPQALPPPHRIPEGRRARNPSNSPPAQTCAPRPAASSRRPGRPPRPRRRPRRAHACPRPRPARACACRRGRRRRRRRRRL
jgi:hypothetical protein